MSIQKPIYWHQGLFLQPQHFQLLDQSFRTLLTSFQHFAAPFFWGIGSMDIQHAMLGTRSFNLAKGQFVFQDGSYVSLPENAVLEARRFEEDWVDGGKAFRVYIGIRKWNDLGENVTVLDKLESFRDVTTRFVTTSDAEEIRDLHAGGPAAPVKRLHYVLKIFWESEKDQLGDYMLIPVAELERVGEEIRLSQKFIPPCVSVTGSETLVDLLREVRDQITSRSHYLEEYKSQRGIQTAEFGTRDMVYLLALRSLNRYVPLFFHYSEVQNVHPWAAYGLVRQLIGELSSFSDKINVLGELTDGNRVLLPYDHWNLWDCFSAGKEVITELLDEITAGPEYVFRLAYDGTYFAAEVDPSIFDGRNRFYLVLRTEENPESILQSMASAAKLSSREQLPILIARALPGVPLKYLQTPPQELPRRANCLYFAVDHHSEQWEGVRKTYNVALYWDNAPDDLEAELMVAG